MTAAGRPGHGMRGRVAERTRAVLGDSYGEMHRPEPEHHPVFEDVEAERAASPPGPAGAGFEDVEAERAASPPGSAGAGPARHRGPDRAPSLHLLRARLRWDPGWRGAAAVALLAVVAVLFTVWQVARSRPQPVAISAAGNALGSAARLTSGPDGLADTTAASAAAAAATPSPARAFVVVDVAGKVRHPGVYRLRLGARVVDAVRAAGGARPHVNMSPLNLAAPVADGQQIVVGAAGAARPPAEPQPAAPVASTPALVDLNSATLDQLESLPGVGPVLGQNILDWRDAHGGFTTVDQLREVTGIGDVRFGQIQPLVTL